MQSRLHTEKQLENVSPHQASEAHSRNRENDSLLYTKALSKSSTPFEEPPNRLDESDSDGDGDDLLRPEETADRRRIQNSVFSSWISNRVEKDTETELKELLHNADDEVLSIRNLMSKQESNVIITDPRDYQVELFEKAKTQNVIAVLDTGSGKTLIAVLLLKHILELELEHRAMGYKHRVAFFLVDCVTLVFQQFAVLECNLDHTIDRFCGDMNCDLWNKSIWDKIFNDNMAIVCTAEVLHNCLLHAFIRMEDINLLIFDEAHHAKKNHAYARIVKDFYLAQTDLKQRPKIFGMTASPVDAKVDVVQAAKDLENILDSQIVTTSDLSLLQATVNQPKESIAEYDPLPAPYSTPLWTELDCRFGEMHVLARLFRFAREATAELGEWCGDQVWAMGLAEEEANKIARLAEKTFLAEKNIQSMGSLDLELKQIQEAKEIVQKHHFPQPSFEGNNISSKARILHAYLNGVFQNPTDARCIVFVNRRLTARLLEKVFRHIGSPHIRLGILIGSRAGEAGDSKVTFRQQVLTLMKFRKGELNCLFATSIAEEGLDIPDCNTIIRFDLYGTLIQYIQSRGRARHKNSRYLHMVERGNLQQLQAIRQVRLAETVMRNFCEALPADRLLQGNDCDFDDNLSYKTSHQVYREPSTGATLTYGSCLVFLAHFVMCLPHDHETSLQPRYIMTIANRLFVCEVLLPESSPIRSITGKPFSRKSMAKRSAAFEACLMLRKGGYLDANLLPIYHKRLPAMRNAHLALGMKKTNVYSMRLKPSIWEQERGSLPTELYLMILMVDMPEGVGRPLVPLALLTRSPIPELPEFPLYVQPGTRSSVNCIPIERSLPVSDSSLAKLTAFTLRIFKDIYNKTYEVNQPQMSYWIAPAVAKLACVCAASNPEDLIDWQSLEFVKNTEEVPWTPTVPHEDLADRYLIDRWDGGRRFFSIGVVPELSQDDPVPEGSATGKYMNSIIEYTVSLFAKSRARITWLRNQPVIKAERVLYRRNWLDDWDNKEKEVKSLAYVCPEPLKFSALSTPIAAAGYLFPAIIFRLEQYLIALEACDLLSLKINPALALEAVTKDSDNTEEHQQEQRQFQRGMGKNYERLEFIGDAFLKMATSISLFAQNAIDDEFESHVKRMLMICNKNLFGTALQIKLYEYVRTQGFSRRTWYPEGLKLLEGKGHKKIGIEAFKHHLSDKSIADVCEALIGAALLSYRDTGNMDMAVKAVTAVVSSPDHDVENWDAYYKLYKMPPYQVAPCSAAQLDLAEKVAKEHSYHFKHPRVLRSAFTHPSFPFSWEKVPCYQRLEFLGDSLLDMACINFLFYRHPDRDPQWLTEHKMAMVSNKFLGALCVKLGFHKHLHLNSTALIHLVQEYVVDIGEAEADSGGARDYWTMTKNPPKCLPDVVESYIGAIFVDSEFDFKEVERFFTTHVQWYFEDMSIYDTFANNHPTTYLSNLLTLNFGCSDFRIMSDELPSLNGAPPRIIAVIMVHNRVIAEGISTGGKYAKLKASSNALELLKGLAPFEYRLQYFCTCTNTKTDPIPHLQPLPEEIGSAI